MAKLAFIICVLSGMACGVAALVSMFRAASMRKPLVPWQLAINLLNVLFDAALYTEDGLRAVRQCKQGIVGFFLFWALAMVMGLSTGVAH